MRSLADIARLIWKWWSYFCGGLVLLLIFFVLLGIRDQSRKDKAFADVNFLPLVKYVESFRDSQHRLPTEEEFKGWASTNREDKTLLYHLEKPSFMPDWGDPGRDFIVGVWNGEIIEYYRSWDRETQRFPSCYENSTVPQHP
jgi:hypothetical protein